MLLEERYLVKAVKEDLTEKMVFIGGPRQVGKTTLAIESISKIYKSTYFNWDKTSQRLQAIKGEWPIDSKLIILDEFHKYKNWKTWIKGEWDVNKSKLKFLLTGSARLNIYRKGGDSLQGRYHYYTLHPFSFAEINRIKNKIIPENELLFNKNTSREALDKLIEFGCFPEPFLKHNHRFLRRWRNERFDRFFKEDIRDLTFINDLTTLMLLAELLPDWASSILSINSLAKDLERNYRTIVSWLNTFEQLYYCFRIPAYMSKKIASVKKEKKLYLWDWTLINEIGHRLENIVACHLLKFCDYLYEYEGYKTELNYLRDSYGRETDFLVTIDKKPWFAVEVKNSDKNIPRNICYFKEKLSIPFCYVIVNKMNEDYIKNDIRIMPVHKFLSGLI